jgi:hypothetical protein
VTAAGRWYDDAACLDVSPTVFEAKTPQGQQAAIRDYCRGCRVRADCLADALASPEHQDHGVRGGKTRKQRQALRKLPDLPTGRDSVTIAALRRLLDQEQPDVPRHPAPRVKRRAPKEPTVHETPAITPAAAEPQPEKPAAVEPGTLPPVRSISDLLDWAERHHDAALRKHATAARQALAVIQQRHAVDAELEKVLREAAQLRERLAELDARAKELKQPAAKAKRDYDPATVRAWAQQAGVKCPAFGVVPKAVVQAWRERAA